MAVGGPAASAKGRVVGVQCLERTLLGGVGGPSAAAAAGALCSAMLLSPSSKTGSSLKSPACAEVSILCAGAVTKTSDDTALCPPPLTGVNAAEGTASDAVLRSAAVARRAFSASSSARRARKLINSCASRSAAKICGR